MDVGKFRKQSTHIPTMAYRISLFILTLLLLAGCVGGSVYAPKTAFQTVDKDSLGSKTLEDIGPQELQAAVMSYVDTSNSLLTEAAGHINRIGTPQARLTAARMMVFDLASNVEIAAGPYPGVAMLDSIVLASLRRMVWEDFWLPEVFGEQAEPALAIFREVEDEAWELAAKIMTQKQMDEVRKVILLWRKKHPNRISVNYVRFAEFGELGLKPSMNQLTVPGGLFSSVEKAALVAQDMKLAMDRAFYLISRMQVIVNFQIKLAYLEMIFQPEADGIIKTTEKVVGLSERYAEIAENMPAEIRVEATKLMDDLFYKIDHQRTQTLDQVLEGMTVWQNQMITNVMENISKEREAAIDQAIAGLVEQQNELFLQMQEILKQSGSEATTLLDQSGDEMEETMDHAFLLGVALILIFFGVLTLYRVFVVRPMDRRQKP